MTKFISSIVAIVMLTAGAGGVQAADEWGLPEVLKKFAELDNGLVLITGATAYYFALDPDSSLVLLLASAYGIISQFAPPVLAALYWKRATTLGVLAGLVAGAVTAFFFWQNPELKPFDMHEGILALLVHVPVLIGASLATAPQDSEHLKDFFE